jgi:hypothetical protein
MPETTTMPETLDRTRRDFLSHCGALGFGATLLPGVLWAKVAAGEEITAASIVAAAEVAGVEMSEEDRALMLDGLKRQTALLKVLHAVPLENSIAPALVFSPLPRPDAVPRGEQRAIVMSTPRARAARTGAELLYAPLTELADLVQRRAVSSVELTSQYLARLERLDPQLLCVTTLTRDRAMAQARAADAEIAAGRYRGPLHGIPWGAKDLLAVKGYPTTWGTAPYRDQVFEEDATVVIRLDAAGAVLIAKLTLGELAQGDRW